MREETPLPYSCGNHLYVPKRTLIWTSPCRPTVRLGVASCLRGMCGVVRLILQVELNREDVDG